MQKSIPLERSHSTIFSTWGGEGGDIIFPVNFRFSVNQSNGQNRVATQPLFARRACLIVPESRLQECVGCHTSSRRLHRFLLRWCARAGAKAPRSFCHYCGTTKVVPSRGIVSVGRS